MTDKLGAELWRKLEGPQGYSFVSDDVCNWPDGKVLEFVRRNLPHVKLIARTFEAINRKYKFEDESND